jgi:hypothetical protein
VNGSITVQSGGALDLEGVLVKGTITASQAKDVDIRDSYMKGLNIQSSAPGEANFTICNNTIAGPVSINSVKNGVRFGTFNDCGGNLVCGPFSANNNTGELRVLDNRIAGGGMLTGNTNLVFQGNSFGGGLSTARNSFPGNGDNSWNNAETAASTCPEALPAPPEEEER